MTAKDGRNGTWCSDTEDRCSTFIASLLHESAKKRMGGPGNKKVHSFHHCSNVLNNQ